MRRSTAPIPTLEATETSRVSTPPQLALDAVTSRILREFHFDRLTFERLRQRLAAEGTVWADTRVAGRVSGLAGGDVTPLPATGSGAHARLAALGTRALRSGQVGVIILAGGMATRFGGVVKAAVPAWRGRTFLNLKIADVRAVAGRTGARHVPVYLMASVATRGALDAMARAMATVRVPVSVFNQCASVRLTPDAQVFRDEAGQPSLYATGHGDLADAFAGSKLLDAFVAAGGRYLVVSNVDNLGASLDPAVIGAHMAAGRQVTVEVVGRRPGDAGGAVLRVNHHPQIVESFRLPAGVKATDAPIFSTNTFVLDTAAMAPGQPFSYFPVSKTVTGRPAIQFERLLGEVTSFWPTQMLRVPRDGAASRFVPIKEPTDLLARGAELEAVLRARGRRG